MRLRCRDKKAYKRIEIYEYDVISNKESMR